MCFPGVESLVNFVMFGLIFDQLDLIDQIEIDYFVVP